MNHHCESVGFMKDAFGLNLKEGGIWRTLQNIL